jgi:uncharacterized protein (DUF2147 family)
MQRVVKQGWGRSPGGLAAGFEANGNYAITTALTILRAQDHQAIEVAMRSFRLAAAALCLAAIGFSAGPAFVTPAFAADPWGNWFTEKKESQIRLSNCGGALCGDLVWLAEPNDPATGAPKTDKHNPDAGKQGRPLLGTLIVLGMKPSGPNEWSGNLYNAEDGKTYTGTFTMTGPDTAALKGCVLVFCKSQTWVRAN